MPEHCGDGWPDEVARRVLSLVGERYRHQGRGPGGYDCVGVVAHAYDRNAPVARYPATADPDQLEAWWKESVDELDVENLEEVPAGAICLFRVGRRVRHLAIKVKDGIVQARARYGVVHNLLPCNPWDTRFVAAGFLKD